MSVTALFCFSGHLGGITSLVQPCAAIYQWYKNKEGVNTPEMTDCRLCGEPIHFDNNIVSERTGKKIPLDEGSDEPHRCAEWEAQHRRYYPCRECNAEIYFDDAHISQSGKHIPISKATGEPHECEVKATRLAS